MPIHCRSIVENSSSISVVVTLTDNKFSERGRFKVALATLSAYHFLHTQYCLRRFVFGICFDFMFSSIVIVAKSASVITWDVAVRRVTVGNNLGCLCTSCYRPALRCVESASCERRWRGKICLTYGTNGRGLFKCKFSQEPCPWQPVWSALLTVSAVTQDCCRR
jgi:hypothetical protein